jgi:hypothetical protein
MSVIQRTFIKQIYKKVIYVYLEKSSRTQNLIVYWKRDPYLMNKIKLALLNTIILELIQFP